MTLSTPVAVESQSIHCGQRVPARYGSVPAPFLTRNSTAQADRSTLKGTDFNRIGATTITKLSNAPTIRESHQPIDAATIGQYGCLLGRREPRQRLVECLLLLELRQTAEQHRIDRIAASAAFLWQHPPVRVEQLRIGEQTADIVDIRGLFSSELTMQSGGTCQNLGRTMLLRRP